MAKEIVEFVRDSLSGEETKGIEEVLLLQALTGSQSGGSTIDPATLLLVLAATGPKQGGGKFKNIVLMAMLMQQQQQAQAAACGTTGMPAPASTSNPLLTALVLGMFDRSKLEVRELGGGGAYDQRLEELQDEIEELREQVASSSGETTTAKSKRHSTV